MVDEFDPKHGQLVALTFTVANVVTAATDTDCVHAQAGITLVTMPKAGSVVGLGVQASAAVTAGSCVFKAQKAGTEYAQSGYPSATMSSAYGSGLASYASIRRGVLTFSAGDSIGVSYTSSTDLAPSSTDDFNAVLYVMFDRD